MHCILDPSGSEAQVRLPLDSGVDNIFFQQKSYYYNYYIIIHDGGDESTQRVTDLCE